MPTSKWTCNVDGNGTASLSCQIAWEGKQPYPPVPVRLKGVCYSPAPLNGSNAYGPAFGDWYWDSFQAGPDRISGWNDLWSRDWNDLQALNLNCLRVYCMISRQINTDGTIPEPWNSGHLFTHQNFLDLCWDEYRSPKFVLVGIPLPDTMFWKTKYDQADPALITFWTEVLRETAQNLANHPAVMGFTVQNELDGASVCYNDPVLAAFWWGQVEKMAQIVKQAAPDKLVGMATHDDPDIPTKAAAYMANCPHIDFWGVNTYQTQSFGPALDPYKTLSGSARKPVIVTEWGMPATTRRDPSDPGSIYEDATTHAKAAATVKSVAPQAYNHPLCIGLYYFEFCDEWWNQPELPNIHTWWSGPADAGFPNGYWDQDGFGLYSIRRGGSLPNSAPIWENNGPALPIDDHTERTELTSVLANIEPPVPK